MWEDTAESMCVHTCFSVLLSDAQKAEQAACMCLDMEGLMVCNVSSKHQLLRLSTAWWWKSCDVWVERSVVMRCGAAQGPGCVHGVCAARHSCNAHIPAVQLRQGPGARTTAEKQLPDEGEDEGPC